ncbi:MAG: NADH-quinone oxidoreductase subunit J [Anaerolineae bacterium]|nr:NADH-quinone oxidoreductase subunit J [Anaerolineae bacterium]
MPINLETIAFTLFAAMCVGGGLGVAVLRNLFHAALSLLLALFGAAGLFVLLSAPFLAMVQILVYMGAIAILILFVIMLTQQVIVPEPYNRQWVLGALAALVALGALFMVIAQLGGGDAPYLQPQPLAPEVSDSGIAALGSDLVDPGRYLVPFEVAGLLLTVALVGAISIARED